MVKWWQKLFHCVDYESERAADTAIFPNLAIQSADEKVIITMHAVQKAWQIAGYVKGQSRDGKKNKRSHYEKLNGEIGTHTAAEVNYRMTSIKFMMLSVNVKHTRFKPELGFFFFFFFN